MTYADTKRSPEVVHDAPNLAQRQTVLSIDDDPDVAHATD